MKEEDLNEALRDVMVRSSPPPSMDPARALDQARRTRKRRRVAWAGVGVATLVAGVGVGPVLITNYVNQSTDSAVASGTTQPVSSVAPTTTRKSGDPWPEGQTDRTATAGPRADRSVTLMNDLSSAVPPGFSTPDLKYPDGRAMRWPQTQYASSDGEQDYWEYRAIIPVQKDDRVGQLLAQSITPDGKPATDPCKLAQKFWGGAGSCSIVDVDGKKVGVVTTKGRGDYDQLAAYRHGDGTVVYLAQAKKSDNPGRAPLRQPVFTTQQLAELVTSEELKIST
ncbi:hypothetical protein BWI15_28275 [Kribbella sp. ALI-6-A]|uniref:hypothetical protein n=1 Tax=Kribbella sp. ALI-6-A TaxID=1933817 RepID=UPI00097CBABC|nr:hypothetical protein [Kribbella sp. ALI-6-A]ONI67076.1 hypothetical protein BWI15_28275 [Kribbella sp. ALI-6-A]